RDVWLAGTEGYGDVTDAVYRLVEDTWLDNWSADKYVGTIFRDSQEAALVDTAGLRVLRIMHQVGPAAPVQAYMDQPGRTGGARETPRYGWRRGTVRTPTRRHGRSRCCGSSPGPPSPSARGPGGGTSPRAGPRS